MFNFLQEVLGRLLGMLFQWFDATAYLPDGMYMILICCDAKLNLQVDAQTHFHLRFIVVVVIQT